MTGAAAPDPAAMLEALRERGAPDDDPLRFRFIEAFARRSAAHTGETRQLLDTRLARLLAAFVDKAEPAPPRPAAAARAALAELVERLDRHAGPQAELKTVRDFRSTWSQLAVDRQIEQSLATLPQKAGPLHSQGLVLRALEAMREISPQYLDRFMSYVDALSWLDQAGGASVPEARDVVRAESGRKRKPARGKTA